MNIDPYRPLQDIAAQVPGSISVLDKLGIDYCHQALESLEAVCRKRGLMTGDVLALLEEGQQATAVPPECQEWSARPLADLISHIVSGHHAFNRREFARLEELFAHILATEARRPAWKLLHNLFASLSRKISSHMNLEEQVVFPHIEELESLAKDNGAPHGWRRSSVQRPIRMMMLEHDSACELMKRIKGVTSNFKVPAGASADWHALYEGLQVLDRDLHHHFFLENNILFPRAVSLESLRGVTLGKSRPD
jgi:regulator of cell morphogenesis and NO signaling